MLTTLTSNQVHPTLCDIVSSLQFLSLPRPLNVLCSRLLVLSAEEAVRVACKPGAEFTDLLAQTVDRLDVHVGLSDHLRHIHYDIRSVIVVEMYRVYDGSGKTNRAFCTSALHRKHHPDPFHSTLGTFHSPTAVGSVGTLNVRI